MYLKKTSKKYILDIHDVVATCIGFIINGKYFINVCAFLQFLNKYVSNTQTNEN